MIGRSRFDLCAIAVVVFTSIATVPVAANIFSSDRSDPRRYVVQASRDAHRLAPVGMIEANFVIREKLGRPIASGGGPRFLFHPAMHLLITMSSLVADRLALIQ